LSTLYFIRHGQASFGQANYDKLSELGEHQSQLLGEYWVNWGLALDAVYMGTLERQRMTQELISRAYQAASRPFPEPTAFPEFNEYDSSGILTGSIAEVVAQHPEIMDLAMELAPDGKPDLVNNKKAFQRLFARVMDLWVAGELDQVVPESWKDFTDRVNQGIDRVIEENVSGKTVAIISSGGPISAAMQRALGTADKLSMELGWPIINSSISEFRFSGNRFSLISFNLTPHLVEPGLISHR